MNRLMNLNPETIAYTESNGAPDGSCDEHRECRDCSKDGKSCAWEEALEARRLERLQDEWEARRHA